MLICFVGTANFPYLFTPDTALHRQALQDNTVYESILDNYSTDRINSLVSQVNITAIVFVNADSGEGYISVDGNEGDRKNLTLWKSGDDLIKTVADHCANTIVVIHSTGPTIVTEWHDHPNVTAILWAGLPGQESGNSITDVLYGKINPAARTPFTWGATRESYGEEILSKRNNGYNAPQDDFLDGVFIDYRGFNARNITPIYEFGFGLSYTSFEYSDLTILRRLDSQVPWRATTMKTKSAPVFGKLSTDINDYLFPLGISKIRQYIYPYISGTNAKIASADPKYGKKASEFLPPHATDSSPQTVPDLKGYSGGEPEMWDVIWTVSAKIKNTGKRNGEEVPQLYISHGGPDTPKIVLRGFERMSIDVGQTAVFVADITRRDLMNWDTVQQKWVETGFTKVVFVGPSSKNLPLSIELT